MDKTLIKIPFNKPCFAGNELRYIKEAVSSGKISGDGMFAKKCTSLMEKRFRAKKIFLTPSATGALDMSSLLIRIKPGDGVIVPSFTFTSTVNAFVMFGGVPQFVDIRKDTMNIDETLIENRIDKNTKAIFCMHYAGVSCEMGKIMAIARKHKLYVVEDSAQGMNAKYKDKYLGTIGDFGVYSFHETKNYNCGEGGALIINNPKYIERAEVIREKGTDRAKFFRGEVDKYTWRDTGSSYLLSEILAAYLYAQIEHLDEIREKRKHIYEKYYSYLENFQVNGRLTLPVIPQYCSSNYHIFHMLLDSERDRNRIMYGLKKAGVLSVYHYLPLHTSPMGIKFGYKKGDLPVTENLSGRLLRLPLYNNLSYDEITYILGHLSKLLH